MSRVQSQRAPRPDGASSALPSLEGFPSGSGAAIAARLEALAPEAREAFGAHRGELLETLNALLEGLPLATRPEEAVPTLHRLLEQGLLDGLEDGSGQPCTVAATRALLALGYPHALEVTPERLAALRHFEGRLSPAPWGSILGVGAGVNVMQLAFVTLSGSGIRRLFGASAAALAGETPPPPTLMDRLRDFWQGAEFAVFYGQLLLGLVGFLLTVTVAGHRKGRVLTRNVFHGLAALGAVVGLAQLPFTPLAAWGTLLAAVGALCAAWLLREE